MKIDGTDSHIHKARLRFREMMPQAAFALIRALLSEVAAAKTITDLNRRQYYAMEQIWPGHINCPACGHHVYTRSADRPRWEHFMSPSADKIMKECGYLTEEPTTPEAHND